MPDNIIALKALVLLLMDKIAALELTISKLEAENVALKAENAELKARLTANTICLLKNSNPFRRQVVAILTEHSKATIVDLWKKMIAFLTIFPCEETTLQPYQPG